MGEIDEVINLYRRIIELDPQNYEALLSHAQFLEGLEAVSVLECAIEYLIVSNGDQMTLSNAYCSLVELYMTDCCDEPDA